MSSFFLSMYSLLSVDVRKSNLFKVRCFVVVVVSVVVVVDVVVDVVDVVVDLVVEVFVVLVVFVERK